MRGCFPASQGQEMKDLTASESLRPNYGFHLVFTSFHLDFRRFGFQGLRGGSGNLLLVWPKPVTTIEQYPVKSGKKGGVQNYFSSN